MIGGSRRVEWREPASIGGGRGRHLRRAAARRRHPCGKDRCARRDAAGSHRSRPPRAGLLPAARSARTVSGEVTLVASWSAVRLRTPRGELRAACPHERGAPRRRSARCAPPRAGADAPSSSRAVTSAPREISSATTSSSPRPAATRRGVRPRPSRASRFAPRASANLRRRYAVRGGMQDIAAAILTARDEARRGEHQRGEHRGAEVRGPRRRCAAAPPRVEPLDAEQAPRGCRTPPTSPIPRRDGADRHWASRPARSVDETCGSRRRFASAITCGISRSAPLRSQTSR